MLAIAWIRVKIVGSSHGNSSIKLAVLKISQISQENTCARASFLITLQVLKNDTAAQVFFLWILGNF